MNEKHKRILGAIQLLDGSASVDEIREASGIDNRDINNALRSLEPEFVEVTGTKPRRGDRRDDPKVLRLTEAGHEVGKEARVKLYEDRATVALQKQVNELRERVSAMEEVQADHVKEKRKLMRLVLDEA